ncbi:DUF3108 domain-containing protein [Bdellovibrio svalbardensis]|uniref:DUF3108 domain-containing protein n=1 Tax=Bdellovibrio svalbardensis TaxID=2972972 RepID=A0ABT6DDG4_9BACT|nr:hypothetical protein [Bdellovibrio svalbardensis]MDG0814881.1 DUF3108 domain-containing protein [Bdellovibrio svalbardensis]
MFKTLIAVLGFAFALNAQAAPSIQDTLVHVQANVIMEAQTMGLDWKVGDTSNYDLNIGGFIKGSMVMSVDSIGADGIWMNQDADLGFAGKQKIQTLIDANTGEIKKVIANGQEQQVPKQDLEIIDTKEEKITVPAGTFDSIHVTARDKASSDKGEINVWLNPQVVPVGGTLKQTAPTQFGTMTLTLKSFKKN